MIEKLLGFVVDAIAFPILLVLEVARKVEKELRNDGSSR